MHRRWGSAGAIVAACAALVACGSEGTAATPKAKLVVTTTEPRANPVTTTERTETSTQVTGMPDGWEPRVTEGPDREETLRLLDEAVTTLGAQRAGYYDRGQNFDVRLVEPTPHDDEVVAAVQARTSIPVTVVAMPVSDSWLQETALKLDGDLSHPAVSTGVDLEAGKLYVAVDHQAAPGLHDGAFTTRVHDLVATYLAEGRERGAVADGVTADEAVDIEDGRFTY